MRNIMTHEMFIEIKTMLKSEAKELRTLKFTCREAQRNHTFDWQLDRKLRKTRNEWRHKHIAFCLLKGRTIDEIEQYCSEDNKRDDALIEKYKKEFDDEQN